MSLHTYPLTAVIGDYSRSAAGLAVSVVPFAVAPSRPLVTYLFGTMIAVFAVYALRTAARHFTRVEVDDDAISANLPSYRKIAWTTIEGLSLRFFPAKKDRSRGWFQMIVVGAGQRLSVDSTITDFHGIVAVAAAAAERNGIALDEATAANIAALTGAAAPSGR